MQVINNISKDAPSEEDTPSVTNFQEERGKDTLIDDIYFKAQTEKFDLHDVMASAVQGGRHEGFKLAHLDKIWRINADTAKKS